MTTPTKTADTSRIPQPGGASELVELASALLRLGVRRFEWQGAVVEFDAAAVSRATEPVVTASDAADTRERAEREAEEREVATVLGAVL